MPPFEVMSVNWFLRTVFQFFFPGLPFHSARTPLVVVGSFRRELAVIRVDEPPLPRVAALPVIAGKKIAVVPAVALNIAVAEELGDLKRIDVYFVDAFLHGHRVYLVRGVKEVSGARGETAVEVRRAVVVDGLHHANVALLVDCVRPDEELVRLLVDESVRGRAADRLGANDARHVGLYLVKLVGRAVRHVRRVRDRPQAPSPRHDRASTTFALAIEGVQFRIDARYKRRGKEN